MYSPDTLQRLNNREVTKIRHKVESGKADCQFCDEKAEYAIPVYNPADGVRDVEGAYNVYEVCQKCFDDGYHLEENFHCANCGELFIFNHSWDVVAVTWDSELYCQTCFAKIAEPVPWPEIVAWLRDGETKHFTRCNALPGKTEIWSGEFSQFSDFPGYTDLDAVADAIETACREAEVEEVYPLVTHGYQFSVVLGIFADEVPDVIDSYKL